MSRPPTSADGPGQRLLRLLEHQRLPSMLAAAALLLTLPSVAVGFHLDDQIHRYLLGDYPGSAELLRAYESPFGIANGEREVNRWQVDNGYAPWWIDPDLLVSLWRPISQATHQLDAVLWPNSAPLMHLHSLLWFCALIFAVTRFYRSVMGAGAVAGLAATLYALDHTHGFAVGWIANRNTLVATLFGVLALWAHVAWRRGGGLAQAGAAGLCFAAALLSGEASVAVVAYVCAYALSMDTATPGRRVLSVVPYLLILLGWRLTYNGLGHGAHGSGLYLDPVREPLAFASAALTRLPLLALGQFGLPPAELAIFAPAPVPALMWGSGTLLLGALVWLCLPGLRRDGELAFFGLGMLASLAAACSTIPNNRLLFYAGLGAMGLLAVLWRRAMDPSTRPVPSAPARGLVALLVGFHLVLSPLLLPLTACSILLTAPAEAAVHSPALTAPLSGRKVVLINSPDYFYTKLIGVSRALEGLDTPDTLHTLAYGPSALSLRVVDGHTLALRMSPTLPMPGLMELYRRSDHALLVDQRVELTGMTVVVERVDDQGRVQEARFVFDAALNDPSLLWLRWDGRHYVPYELPAVGAAAQLDPAQLPVLGGG